MTKLYMKGSSIVECFLIDERSRDINSIKIGTKGESVDSTNVYSYSIVIWYVHRSLVFGAINLAFNLRQFQSHSDCDAYLVPDQSDTGEIRGN